jgi:nucleoside-diphosphate-sugar epimerase
MTHSETNPLHVVLGAGQIGRKLTGELLSRGHRVRLVRRGPAGPARPGLEWLSGDLMDPAFADRALEGAQRVYNCVNPPDYGRWAGVMEPLHEAVQDAAVRATVPLVGLDCLYMVGIPEQTPFDEETPMRPIREKGEMRARLVRRALRLREEGKLQVTFGRAPDYFGPDSPDNVFGERFLERLRAGASAEVFGDPDLPRSYAYTPDVAAGLAVLGTDERGFDRAIWHLPVAETRSTRELVEAFYREAGVEPALRRLPRWLLRTAGLFSPVMRELAKMSYQWEVPYALDDRRFRQTFGVQPTPVGVAVRETLAAAGILASQASAA